MQQEEEEAVKILSQQQNNISFSDTFQRKHSSDIVTTH